MHVCDNCCSQNTLFCLCFVAIMCAIFFFVSIPFTLGNGLYLFQLFDQFAGTLPLLFIGFCEVGAISYVYGVKRFVHHLLSECMHISFTFIRFFGLVQHDVPVVLQKIWFIVWTFISPPVMAIIFIGSVINELVKPLEYTQFTYDIDVRIFTVFTILVLL